MIFSINSNDLPGMLKSPDSGENIEALQYLIENLNFVNNYKLGDHVKKLTQSSDVGVRFWAKKLCNNLGKYETEQANAKAATISKDLPVDILIHKLKSIASTYISLDVIKKLCESKKLEALDFLKTYISSCQDNIQISYLTKDIGLYFPSDETLVFLIPFLKHDDDRVVANTIEGIEAIESVKGVILFSQLLDHKSNRVRTNAAIALGKFDAEKSFAVVSKMLSPESDAHFQISACHAIKTLRDCRFLEQLESALLNEITFSAALDAIEAIGGLPAIMLLTKVYSKIPTSKQSQVDATAAKLARLEEKAIEKPEKEISSSETCSKDSIVEEELSEQLLEKLSSFKDNRSDQDRENQLTKLSSTTSNENTKENAQKEEGSSSQKSNSMKNCPFCAEEIKFEAKVCKHCGREIVTEALNTMAGETKKCPSCAKNILAMAKYCKHCGSEIIYSQHASAKPPSIQNEKSSALLLLIIAGILFFGNFHVITGSQVETTITKRDSFGFSEIFINVDEITSMPWIAAVSKYPLTCRVLAREGYIESDSARKARIERETEAEFKKRMRDF